MKKLKKIVSSLVEHLDYFRIIFELFSELFSNYFRIIFELFSNCFRSTRNHFIEYRMREILKQQKINLISNNCNNEIDRLVLEKKSIIREKYCLSCEAPNDRTFRVCRNCGENLIKRTFTIHSSSSNIPDPYSHFNIEENPNQVSRSIMKTVIDTGYF